MHINNNSNFQPQFKALYVEKTVWAKMHHI